MASLVDLPAELLTRIASHLFSLDPATYGTFRDEGFRNLRLCCRLVETKTRYSFERAAFSGVAVTLGATSLGRLQDISSQPEFGRLIKKLVFLKAHHPVFDQAVAHLGHRGKHEYADYGVIELPREGTDGVYPNRGLTLRKRVRLGLQNLFAKVMAATPNFHEIVIEPNFMASFWLDSPSRQEQLNEAAQRIYTSTKDIAHDRTRHAPGPEHEDDEEDDSELDILDGENQDYDNDDYDDPYHLETYVYPDYLLYLIAQAAHQPGLELLRISSSNANSSSVRARTFVELAPAIQSLQHLDISLSASSATKLVRMNGDALQSHTDGKPIARSFSHALNTLQNLRSLTLTFDEHYWENDRLPNISASLSALGQQSFEFLCDIDICFACFEGHVLCHFLHNQRTVLQQLKLHQIVLSTVGHWHPIMAMLLAEAPMLVKLNLSGLSGWEEFNNTSPRPCSQAWESCSMIHCSRRDEALIELQRALGYFSGGLDSSIELL